MASILLVIINIIKLQNIMNKKNLNLNNLKIALIVTTGRTGSDYLNCCLDNLEGLITFCGKFNYHQFFENQYH